MSSPKKMVGAGAFFLNLSHVTGFKRARLFPSLLRESQQRQETLVRPSLPSPVPVPITCLAPPTTVSSLRRHPRSSDERTAASDEAVAGAVFEVTAGSVFR